MEPPPGDVKGMLGPNEQVQLYIREKVYRPKINIDSVVITNERIILRHPHAMGMKKDYTDYNYQDIVNVVLKRGVIRSSLRCTLRLGGDPLSLDDLPNSDAQRAYGIIRENLVRYQTPFVGPASGVPPMRQAVSPAKLLATSCGKCGSQLTPGQKFCGNCGQPV
jgi:hypothetical protein